MSAELDEQMEIQDDLTPETDEQVEVIENDTQDEQEQETIEQDNNFDPKRDRVDFDTPEQQAKFNDVYKQMKISDQRNQMLMDLLEKQQEKIDSLSSRFEEGDRAQAEKLILDKLTEAQDNDDIESYNKHLKDLIALNTEKLQPQKKDEKRQVQSFNDFSENETNYMLNMAQERDESGQLARPWIYENDPNHQYALQKAAQISQRYDPNDPLIVQKVMNDLDYEMRNAMSNSRKPPSKPNNRAPDPMAGSNLTNTKTGGKIKMNDREQEIAKKLGVDPAKYQKWRDR